MCHTGLPEACLLVQGLDQWGIVPAEPCTKMTLGIGIHLAQSLIRWGQQQFP